MFNRLWMIDDFNFSVGLKIILIGFIGVLLSTFILAPIVFRGIELVNDEKISAILKKIVERSKVKKVPVIYKIRTAQLNAIAYFILNKPCIGLSTGLLEAYYGHVLNDQDLECIFAHLLYYHKSRNTFKRNFMYGIASLYNSICYIFLFSGRGFLRLARITEQKGSNFFARIAGYICIIIGIIFRIPEKLSSIIASPLIFSFQKDADIAARKITGPKEMQEVLQKMVKYNGKINKDLSLLPDSEYWFIQPVKLLKIDQLFLFRPSFDRRMHNFFPDKLHDYFCHINCLLFELY